MVTNSYGNQFDTSKAFDFMAQQDQALFDAVESVAASLCSEVSVPGSLYDVIFEQTLFDKFCSLWIVNHGETFILDTKTPQW